jgi:hypothetical protein
MHPWQNLPDTYGHYKSENSGETRDLNVTILCEIRFNSTQTSFKEGDYNLIRNH